jgi:ParB family chromosome partitioning protein
MGLKDKASRIDFGSLPGILPVAAADEATLLGPRPKTAPGLMMAQAADQRSEILKQNEALKSQIEDLSAAAARADELRDELKAWDGAKATRLIDAKLVARSPWANRDPRHFASAEFESLKAEIANAGGNVQPVKVRPVAAGADAQAQYELVFGHRRLEACAQLGLPVLAMVENLGDAALFVEMDRENRSRKDLSAWEQGVMYRRALDRGLFPSNRKLAEAVGADLSNVGKALALASLPEELVSAFASPLDLQYRWAKPLKDAWEAEPQVVRERAAMLSGLSNKPKARVVFDHLVGASGGGTVQPPAVLEVQLGGQRAAVVAVNARAQATVTFEPGLVAVSRLPELAQLIERFLSASKQRAR